YSPMAEMSFTDRGRSVYSMSKTRSASACGSKIKRKGEWLPGSTPFSAGRDFKYGSECQSSFFDSDHRSFEICRRAGSEVLRRRSYSSNASAAARRADCQEGHQRESRSST